MEGPFKIFKASLLRSKVSIWDPRPSRIVPCWDCIFGVGISSIEARKGIEPKTGTTFGPGWHEGYLMYSLTQAWIALRAGLLPGP